MEGSGLPSAAACRLDRHRVLLIDGDDRDETPTGVALRPDGFDVERVRRGEAAVIAADAAIFDVVVLELDSLDMPGERVLDTLRSRGCTTPVLVLSARASVAVKIATLDAGADDFLGKPYDPRELTARLKALARRSRAMRASFIACNNVSLSPEQRALVVDGKVFGIGRREYMLLSELMRRVGYPVAKARLHESLYGFDEETCSNPIEVHVHRIRRRLRAVGAGVRIESRRGIGYVLLPDEPQAGATTQ